jgi:molybdenum cofactor biosynthesis protein B
MIDDQSGDIIDSLLSSAGHKIMSRVLIPDSQSDLTREIKKAVRSKVDSIIVCGGTGITRQDVTIEVAEKLLDKQIPGFGEIFRKISYDEIGSAAVLSRALAGVVSGKVLFCIPGSTDAVRLATRQLILPEISHMVKHASE